MIQFLRDLALLPAMWRRAVAAERQRRFRESPEGLCAMEDEVLARHAHDAVILARLRATAPSGRFRNPLGEAMHSALSQYGRIGQP